MRVLHFPWDDHLQSQRQAYAQKAEVEGRRWVVHARAHVANSINYYYLHWVYAHIREKIVACGHPLNGDDSVLEKGNNNAGRLKRTVFWGGSDAKDADGNVPLVKYVRRVEELGVDGDMDIVEHEHHRERAHGRSYQMMGLQLMGEHLSSMKRARALASRTSAVTAREHVKKEEQVCARNQVITELEDEVSMAHEPL